MISQRRRRIVNRHADRTAVLFGRLRFGLKHLFAFTTLFAIGASSGVLLRDGTWEVVSIEEEGIGCWIGEDPDTGEPMGGPMLAFFATVLDGDRVRRVEIGGDRLWSSTPRPEVGDLIQFTDAQANTPFGFANPTWLLEVMGRRFQDRQELANAHRFNRIV